MIRINLLSTGHERARRPAGGRVFATAQKITVGCSLILIFAALFCGWRYWTVRRLSTQVDRDISAAQQETARLHAVIVQVQQFEQRKAQLQQRVVLIEQLRRGQTGPVHLLDEVSRALPAMLWLTQLKQVGSDVVIDGRCTNLTGLSDFVGNLEATGYFKRSIEIVSTSTEAIPQRTGELVRFTIRAQFQQPGDPARVDESGKGPRPAAAPAPGGAARAGG
jgi:type IV pilus assembly protein PilN